jgi:chemotaxis protein MotB
LEQRGDLALTCSSTRESIIMSKLKLGLMLCAALLATGCVSESTYKAEVQTANNYSALNQQLSAQLRGDQAEIVEMQDQLKVTLIDSILFPEGDWKLNATGERVLAKIAPTLANLPGQQIVVQGFTDNVPIGPELRSRFPSNLELSTARANDVARYLMAKGVSQNTISTQGFGDEHPVASNDSPEGRAKNRRVEIVIKAASQQ